MLDAIVGGLRDLVLARGRSPKVVLRLAWERKGIGGRWSCHRIPGARLIDLEDNGENKP
jgi:hypothetical protein